MLLNKLICGGKRNVNVFLTPVLNNTDTCDSIAEHVHVNLSMVNMKIHVLHNPW